MTLNGHHITPRQAELAKLLVDGLSYTELREADGVEISQAGRGDEPRTTRGDDGPADACRGVRMTCCGNIIEITEQTDSIRNYLCQECGKQGSAACFADPSAIMEPDPGTIARMRQRISDWIAPRPRS